MGEIDIDHVKDLILKSCQLGRNVSEFPGIARVEALDSITEDMCLLVEWTDVWGLLEDIALTKEGYEPILNRKLVVEILGGQITKLRYDEASQQVVIVGNGSGKAERLPIGKVPIYITYIEQGMVYQILDDIS